MRQTLVIGAGIAGLAAAWEASRHGDEVKVLDGGPGASGLSGGAIDAQPWEELVVAAATLNVAPPASPLTARADAFVKALDRWRLAPVGGELTRLATLAGRVRPARGGQREQLDLAQLPSGDVLLPRADRASWDADVLARALSADPFARRRGLRFLAVDAPITRFLDERYIPDLDLAARHDEPGRVEWLAERLRIARNEAIKRGADVTAVLLGPWLGLRSDGRAASDLTDLVGVPVGEALGSVGSAPGLRFEHARDELLARLNVEVIRGWATRLELPETGRLRVEVRDQPARKAHRVVLALGGLAAGGIALVGADPDMESGVFPYHQAKQPYELSVKTPFDLLLSPREGNWAGGAPRRQDGPSSMHGPELDVVAWPTGAEPGVLEDIGVANVDGAVAPGVMAAGDVRAARPRTVLEAVESGIIAGGA